MRGHFALRVNRFQRLLINVVMAVLVLSGLMIGAADAAAARSTPCAVGFGGSGSGYAVAFQANTGSLWTTGPGGNANWQLGMMPGTSPAIAGLSTGGYAVAFQANTGSLWIAGPGGCVNRQLGMMPGTSPAITALTGGGFEVAFQANTGALWTVGSAGNTAWPLGMKSRTSPGIAGLAGGGFEVAFQANTGALWTVGSAGNTAWPLGMAAGTSPGITGLPAGGLEVAFQANTGALWTVGSAGNTAWGLGMMTGTGPTVVGLPPGPGFTSSIAGIDGVLAARMSSSWRPGSPVALSGLRYVTVSYRGFDGADHVGELVIAASVASPVVGVFRELYERRYPIASLRLVDDFGGSDDRSMSANNTSAFNCRPVTGGGGFSEHSYGTAIDINPVQNPYVSGSTVAPPQGRSYLARTPGLGVITAGDVVVTAFARIGWSWGGSWISPVDYQHFSATGR